MKKAWLNGIVGVFAASLVVAPAHAQEPVPVFRSSVSLVAVNAVVKDRRGRPVRNLKKDDFQILEDGVAQQVASLVMVHGGRTYNLQLAPPPPPVPVPGSGGCTSASPNWASAE